MNGQRWLRNWLGRRQGSKRRTPARRPSRTILETEYLEARWLPSLLTLASFNGGKGATPVGTLVEDSNGTLFGTASAGGSVNGGTIFSLPSGSGVINVLGSFGVSPSTGSLPSGGLIEDSSGNFFGTTQLGGNSTQGTVFEYSKATATLRTFWTFSSHPHGGVIEDSSGNLYLTTYPGGSSNDGFVLKVTKFGTGAMTLATFNGANGANPYAGLVMDSSGNLFGTTYIGGSANDGTVFEVLSGSGTVTNLATFTGANGANPYYGNLVLDSSGNLFGTTSGGGAAGVGTVFEVVKNSGTVTTLATFNYANGASPYGGLVADSSGDLFGTTSIGGASNDGTVFEVVNGSGAVTTLATFTSSTGTAPYGGLVKDSSGNLFGTTASGGASSDGTVFELAVPQITTTTLPGGDVSTAYSQTINAYSGGAPQTFGTIGTLPPGLTLSSGGVLAGTPTSTGNYTFDVTVTISGGAYDIHAYTVAINPAVSIMTTTLVAWTANQPGYNQTILTTGGTSPSTFVITSGTLPLGLTLASNGVLSGTPTSPDGYTFTVTATDSVGGAASMAYMVMINPPVTFNSGIITLGSFNGGNGIYPYDLGALVEDSSGNLFGTAAAGGTASNGSVFEVLKGSGSITALASFSGSTGFNPVDGLIEDGSGNLFGTTKSGGSAGDGTVFEMPKGGSTIMTLASFVGTNGSGPYGGVIEDSSGNLYGTTSQGGSANDGIVFEWQKATGTIATLATLTGSNGANPEDGLVEDSAGDFLGTTVAGGSLSDGTVFEIQKGAGTITTIASFNGSNGSAPVGALIDDSSGNLFGTTSAGGSFNDGTVFEVQGNTITPLASFNGGNGAAPTAGLVEDNAGNLFGTTSSGGSANDGTVFEVQKGSGTAMTLAAFSGPNGSTLYAGLVEDSSGNLFGTASAGGASNYGTVFQVFTSPLLPTNWTVNQPGYSQSIIAGGGTGTLTYALLSGTLPTGLTLTSTGLLSGTPTAAGTYNFTVAATDSTGASASHNFAVTINPAVSIGVTTVTTFNSAAAFVPTGTPLLDNSGNLFGTTHYGGTSYPGYGTVFELPNGGTNVIPLATFNTGNGSPLSGVVEDTNGNLFGSTFNGGASNDGTLFEVVKASGIVTTLATFNGSNGSDPTGLAEDSSGNLFGGTYSGGTANAGTVFEWVKATGLLITLANFNETNGANPTGPPIVDSSGNLFGTTAGGGSSSSYGTVFEIQKGSGTLTTLFTFSGANGYLPNGLVADSNGDLFGTTSEGGSANDGTVFELSSGSYQFSTLAVFSGSNGDYPDASLTLDSAGNLFGTTVFGGLGFTGVDTGDGTVFEVAKGNDMVTPLAVFNGANGFQVFGGVVFDASGDLIGLSSGGGTNAAGTVFLVAPLAKGTVGEPSYSQTIPASGGTGMLTFVAPLGGLPPGLTLSAGQLSGTPTAAGTYSFEVAATDSLGVSASAWFTVTINPAVTITTASLGNGSAGAAYSQTITASGGTGSLTFSMTAGTLPPGLRVNSVGVLSGTPTAAGTYGFTLTATDSVGASGSKSLAITISPGPLNQYLVAVLGSSTIQAGSSFQVSAQAADVYGNPITNYSGPAYVTATINPTRATSNFPITVSINGFGFGFFLANLQKVGTYTISVADGSHTYTGSTGPVNVSAGSAAKLAFAAQPVSTPTGVTLPPVTVDILDAYGNVVTSDNSDQVTLGVASGPPGAPGFLVGSTTTATAASGVATFANLTLVKPGSYTLSEQVTTLYSGPNSNVFTVAPLQVLPGSFVGTPSGFSLQFNAPYLANATTPVLYGQGFGATAPVPSLTLTQVKDGSGNPVHNVIAGSLVLNTVSNSLTFVATNTSLETDNHSPLLPDGSYNVVVHSSAANDGFQALNSGAGFLDGLNTGTPGSGDYMATFTVNAAAAHDDALWVPAAADGPGLPLCAPGKNQVGGGYPVYLSDGTGTVSSIQATLTYNPALLTVTPTSTSTFTVTVPMAGSAVLQYSGPALPTGSQMPIGFITATVPPGTTSSPIPYKAKDLLHLSGVSVNGGAIPVVTSDGLHLVAYVGDADGNGAYSSNDAVLITRALLSADTGFTAYPLVDPVIVSDTDGAGFIPADAALQANEAGVAFPTANLPIPPIPSGVHFQATIYHAEALTNLPAAQGPGSHPVAARTASSPLLDFFINDRKILDLYFARLENPLGA